MGQPPLNPRGRPKGSHTRGGLLQLIDHLSTMLGDVKATQASLQSLRANDPAGFYGIVAKLLPREHILTHLMPPAEPEMSEAELRQRINAIMAKASQPPAIEHQPKH